MNCANANRMPGLRIVQLDLARQMETIPFIKGFIDRVAEVGYDTLQLYLEARVATKTFALPGGERYTPGEMREVVAHAVARGMTVVPVVSLLGHAELFFKQPECRAFMEPRTDDTRLGSGDNTGTFCLSNPATRTFLAAYLADLAKIFPGPFFHAGFDEAWNAGTCPLCRKRELEGEYFADCVLFAHDTLAALGKRMWRWDDFLAFHPKALARIPRDVVMMHWCYDGDISGHGCRQNFAGRLREDALEKYASLGYDAVPCWWRKPGNIRSFITYARRQRVFGCCHTQWEEFKTNFHGGSLPLVHAAAVLMDAPDGTASDKAFASAVRRCWPSLRGIEVAAAVRLLEDASDELALEVLKSSPLAKSLGGVEADPFCEKALFDDLLLRGEIARAEKRIRKAEALLADPRRTEADVAEAKTILAPLANALVGVAARRSEQARVWRNGLPGKPEAEAERLSGRVSALMESASVATANEKSLEVELTLVDVYGIPWWKAWGRFDGTWREIASGIWKPGPGDGAAFVKKLSFKSDTMPEAIRLEHHGYGEAQLRFIMVVDRSSRLVPKAIAATSGAVRDAGNVLVDDFSAATFGRPGFLAAFRDKALQEAVSSITIELAAYGSAR